MHFVPASNRHQLQPAHFLRQNLVWRVSRSIEIDCDRGLEMKVDFFLLKLEVRKVVESVAIYEY